LPSLSFLAWIYSTTLNPGAAGMYVTFIHCSLTYFPIEEGGGYSSKIGKNVPGN
jgi:hypothetical protein